MIRGIVALAAAAILTGAGPQANPRACHFPARQLQSPRDTAAWCARDFIIRNGYTDAPASSNRDDIVLEPGMDAGVGFSDAIANRRNTVSSIPLRVCETGTGYLVSFAMPNQLNMAVGKGVAMNQYFMGLALMQPLVSLDATKSPLCSVPRLP
jgi:hypothetical protein